MTTALWNSERQFSGTVPRNTAENTVKHRDGSVVLVVANHRDGGESSVVVNQHYKKLKSGLVASYATTSGLEMEWVFSGGNR